MFGKLFGKRNTTSHDATVDKAALLDAAIDKARATNPVAHLQIGAEELVHKLLTALTSGHGVHIESALGITGSLAGYCCIDSVLRDVASRGPDASDSGIVTVDTEDGNRYFLGDPINALLSGNTLSLWPLVAGMINHLGSEDYPDLAEIAGHVAGTLGSPQFGLPRVPPQHQPGDLPINYVRDLWPAVRPQIEHRVPVLQERVTLFGFAAQKIMEMGKDVIPPAIAGKLIFECAVPMSKLESSRLWRDDIR